MSDTIEVRVPDIGDFKDVPVIEVLVKAGDRVKKNDSLITLESEKASMEVPAEVDGVVQDVKVKVGDKVGKGTPILVLSSAAPQAPKTAAPETPAAARPSEAIEVRVPDIGDFKDVPVIEVLVKPGDRVKKNDSLVTLESEKASMEVPAEADGVVQDVKVKVGDKVAKGSPILMLSSAASHAPKSPEPPAAARPQPPPQAEAPQARTGSRHRSCQPVDSALCARARRRPPAAERQRTERTRHARRRAELREGRAAERHAASSAAFPGLPPWPKVDFAQYGEIERKPLSRIKKLSGPNLHRNWLQIPHITNYDEADVTRLKRFATKSTPNRRSQAARSSRCSRS